MSNHYLTRSEGAALSRPHSRGLTYALMTATGLMALMVAGCASEAPTPEGSEGPISAQTRSILNDIKAETQESLAHTPVDTTWSPNNSVLYQDILRDTDIVYDEKTASFINQEGAPASRQLWQQALQERRSQPMNLDQTPSPSGS